MLTGRGIRLVVLSACETSKGDTSQPFAAIAESLVRAGMPAVVANQLPLKNETVATFVGPFYSKLVLSGDIDQAMCEGRISLATELDNGNDATLEWGIPNASSPRMAARSIFRCPVK